MLGQSIDRHCATCSSITRFNLSGVYPDGSQRVICSGCNANGGVIHKCHSNLFTQSEWLPLVLAGIDIVCPTCKAAYDLGVKIEPAFPSLSQLLEGAALVVGSVLLIGAGVEIAQALKKTLSG